MYVATHAKNTPDKPAYIMGGSGETVTYRELDDRSNRLAQLLYDRGLRPGDSIAICMENNPRFFEATWAAQRSGLYYTAASSRLTTEELAYIVNDCGAQALIMSKAKADAAAEVVDRIPEVHTRLMVDGVIDGFESYEDAVKAHPAEPLAEEREGTDMLYSSGTTGFPKGIKVPLPDAVPGDQPSGVELLSKLLWGATDESIYLSPAPLYHSAPLRFTMAMQRIGGTVVVMEHFDPIEMLRLVERHKVTHLQVVPTMFVRMLKLPEAERTQFDLSSPASRHPRRRAVPRSGQAADDRVVGPDRSTSTTRAPRATGSSTATPRSGWRIPAPWARPSSAPSTSATRTGPSSRPVSRARSTSRARRASSTTTIPRRPRARGTRPHATGRRSATSATSMRTASCTSLTARRS